MPIDYQNTAYGQLNKYLVALNNVNFGLSRVMAQERRADDAEDRGEIQISDFARDWFSRKRDAFAEHRNVVIEHFGSALEKVVFSYLRARVVPTLYVPSYMCFLFLLELLLSSISSFNPCINL